MEESAGLPSRPGDADLGLTDEDPEGQSSAADARVVEQGEAVEVQPVRGLAKPASLSLLELSGHRARIFHEREKSEQIFPLGLRVPRDA